ncbi:PREDICTED: snRNA-activating protein complex subunit 3 [Nicrophorus vespilloides]|uniref:snRNA-activating protein complex subunit 3 n=1 Tax=Nicrophorus vespilloides TaxID=110193 RepID=A0ABM1MM77_NICVS|nr:PREDICTED: snRNA-activating protein complex subunit 3 [Nicrophorus vespilloides]XP_017775675.1 PREDICTED: snRNA-activating protein complex subunit 3 [Nicrophorus vespilloides]XP_017775677.1 PREDICTED: snRNA-activating protein complex subunit 3 [Nicrophorus vespilloides]
MSKSKTKYVYNPKLFTITEPLNIQEHFKEFSDLVVNDLKEFEEYQDIKGPSTARLIQICNPETLTIDNEIPVESNKVNMNMAATFPMSYNSDYTDLQILKSKQKFENKTVDLQPFPYYEKELMHNETLDLKPYEEVLLTVKVYKSLKIKNVKACQYEIAILSCHSLLDLKNKMLCNSDVGFCKEIQHPDETIPGNVKEEYPSGFLFIENCFYNITDHSNAIDYSEIIRDWASKCNMVQFTTAVLEETIIKDLKIILGAPYLFQHQGNCEHVFVFSDARLINGKDPLSSSVFPYILSENKKYTKLCFICQKIAAKFVVTNCDRLPHKYNLFCKNCLMSYNYLNGEKIGKFKLYPYYNQSLLYEHAFTD